jgi:hypothetical protein
MKAIRSNIWAACVLISLVIVAAVVCWMANGAEQMTTAEKCKAVGAVVGFFVVFFALIYKRKEETADEPTAQLEAIKDVGGTQTFGTQLIANITPGGSKPPDVWAGKSTPAGGHPVLGSIRRNTRQKVSSKRKLTPVA